MLAARRLGSNWHPRRLQAPRNPAHAAAAVGPPGHLKVLFTEFTRNFLCKWQLLDLHPEVLMTTNTKSFIGRIQSFVI